MYTACSAGRSTNRDIPCVHSDVGFSCLVLSLRLREVTMEKQQDILDAYSVLGDVQYSMVYRKDLRLTIRVERNNEGKWEVSVAMQKPKNHFKMFYALSVHDSLLLAVQVLPDKVVHDEIQFKETFKKAIRDGFLCMDIPITAGSLASS